MKRKHNGPPDDKRWAVFCTMFNREQTYATCFSRKDAEVNAEIARNQGYRNVRVEETKNRDAR